jgi:hypothetical protein
MRRLLALGPRGWWRLVEAQGAIVRAHAQVRLRPLGALVTERVPRAAERSAEARSDDASGAPDAAHLTLARELEQAVSRVARLGLTRPLCLARSLALAHLLRRHGIPDAVVRVGVRMTEGALRAHAWVEWRGIVLGDTLDSVRSYTQIGDLTVLAHGASFHGTRAA